MLLIFFLVLAQFLAILMISFYLITGYDPSWLINKYLSKFLKIKLYEDQSSPKLSSDASIYLFNHKCFADFFIDAYIAGYVSHLSRLMVLVPVPVSLLLDFYFHRIMFFWRGYTKKSTLASRIDLYLKDSKRPMIIYPEGTRNLTNDPLPLKFGGLKICYDQGYKIQLIHVRGKDSVINEKKLRVSFNQECFVSRSELINPSDYPTFDDFYHTISSKWLSLWNGSLNGDYAPYEPSVPLERKLTYKWFLTWLLIILYFVQ